MADEGAPVPSRRGRRKIPVPSLGVEKDLWGAGHELVAGVDEVGRGAWAGPLSVGVAVIPRGRRVYKVRDSKLLSESAREGLFDRLASWCLAWSVGHASPEECDSLGMSEAQRLATRRAMGSLGAEPDCVLVDGRWDFVGGGRTRLVVRGDQTCLSIAAASVLAKVTRDRLMRSEAGRYPAYGFEANKGYPCPRHIGALRESGPTAIHRRSWAFMDSLGWGPRLAPTGGQLRMDIAGGRRPQP